jgi:ribulose-5-phosphate 4-epimerase/fuculose-1-phosphate aldolase
MRVSLVTITAPLLKMTHLSRLPTRKGIVGKKPLENNEQRQTSNTYSLEKTLLLHNVGTTASERKEPAQKENNPYRLKLSIF